MDTPKWHSFVYRSIDDIKERSMGRLVQSQRMILLEELTVSRCPGKLGQGLDYPIDPSQIDVEENNPRSSLHSSQQSQALSNAQIELIQASDIEIQTNQINKIIDVAKESSKQVAINKPKETKGYVKKKHNKASVAPFANQHVRISE